MRRLAFAFATAALAGAAGCGGDDVTGSGSTAATSSQAASEPDTSVQLTNAPRPPAGAARTARRCSLAAPQRTATVRVPPGLLPEGAYALRGDGRQGKLVFASTLRVAYSQMLNNAKRLGLTIERQELEGVDAELELSLDEGVLRFGFGPAGLCRNVSQASVALEGG